MRLPISLALGWPNRVAGAANLCTWNQQLSCPFEPVDHETFPAIEHAGRAGGWLPAIYRVEQRGGGGLPRLQCRPQSGGRVLVRPSCWR
ncbi:hypothetical protein [Saccharopolyspora elongata]|uniref:hypothetical protein n=1 Tax=Saccharopolyspora elongata TaxID=2530387 RepID=UPI001F18E6F4|nr:hypothetical protein [Saccharopolyspora elongata]